MAKVAKRVADTNVVDEQDFHGHHNQKSNSLKLKLDHMKTFQPLTENQRKFFEAYKIGNYFISLLGVAGSGKSFIALYKALEEVMDNGNPFHKVIIVRSAVQSREMGHMPGDINEKMALYEQPYIQITHQLFDRKDAYQRLKEQDKIEFVSTSFIRGMSFDNSIIIVDEMQNCSFEELSTIITRTGHQSKIIFCGDYRQTDLKKSNDKSGLKKFHEISKKVKDYVEVEFTVDDIVRSSLVKNFIVAQLEYEDENENE